MHRRISSIISRFSCLVGVHCDWKMNRSKWVLLNTQPKNGATSDCDFLYPLLFFAMVFSQTLKVVPGLCQDGCMLECGNQEALLFFALRRPSEIARTPKREQNWGGPQGKGGFSTMAILAVQQLSAQYPCCQAWCFSYGQLRCTALLNFYYLSNKIIIALVTENQINTHLRVT